MDQPLQPKPGVRTFVDVVLPLAVPNLYSYHVPEELLTKVKFGVRVEIQFGRNKLYSGLVVAVHSTAPTHYRTKPILAVLDDQPLIGEVQWQFWQWIARYYCCTPGEVMQAALPSNLKLNSETRIILSPFFDGNYADLTDKEYLITEALTIQKELTLDDVRKILNLKSAHPVVSQLLQKKLIYIKAELQEKFKPKTIACIRLKEPYRSQPKFLEQAFEKLSRSNRQVEALMAFITMSKKQEFVRKQEVYDKAGVDANVVRTIENKGIWEVYEREVDRFGDFHGEIEDLSALSGLQAKALVEITHSFENQQVVLLYGVTGSGKTRIYVELIRQAIQQGSQALYLLPEIALTAQIVNRLQQVFGDKIAVYHSRLSNNERVEIWQAVAQGKLPVLLGARSALLLPFRNLRMVIVDEEHDPSFKQQDPAPRYQGRDAAIYLAHLTNSKVLLGTATPAIETYYNAKNGKYGLVELRERFSGMQLPELILADVKKEQKERRLQSHFSTTLLDELRQALERGEQAILFQNRRGYAPTIRCAICQWHQQCTYCDVSLTYHKASQNLQCHYCGYTAHVPKICPACGSPDLKLQGFGTEKIEDELKIYFPKARVARMDFDTVRTRNAHAKIINDFEEGRVDILVGTQMVTKGLDFDNVGLVGIISADQLYQFPDFRAGERAFQLMEQVSGRAGRKNKRGKVVIQAMNINHPVLQYVLQHDFSGFYESEITERQTFRYPPFAKLIKVTLRHKKPDVLDRAATLFAERLKARQGSAVIGPAVPYIARIRDLFLLDILLKLDRNIAKVAAAKLQLMEIARVVQFEEGFSTVRISIDVDPF